MVNVVQVGIDLPEQVSGGGQPPFPRLLPLLSYFFAQRGDGCQLVSFRVVILSPLPVSSLFLEPLWTSSTPSSILLPFPPSLGRKTGMISDCRCCSQVLIG